MLFHIQNKLFSSLWIGFKFVISLFQDQNTCLGDVKYIAKGEKNQLMESSWFNLEIGHFAFTVPWIKNV